MSRSVAAVLLAACLLPAAAQERPESTREPIAERRPVDADTGAEDLQIGTFHISVWRPAETAGKPAPVVIFSHGFHGTSTQSTFLMKALAAHGYLVLAPDHADSSREIDEGSWKPEAVFRRPEQWSPSTYRDRADDIAALVEFLKIDPAWKDLVDLSRIALAGHSLGGYTVLGLGGAWPEWKLPEVKAVLALSPYCAPFILNGSLHNMDVPVMYQSGTKDIGIVRFITKDGGAWELSSSPKWYVGFRDAAHFAWSDRGGEFHESIVYYTLAFLDRYLNGGGGGELLQRRPDVADMRSK